MQIAARGAAANHVPKLVWVILAHPAVVTSACCFRSLMEVGKVAQRDLCTRVPKSSWTRCACGHIAIKRLVIMDKKHLVSYTQWLTKGGADGRGKYTGRFRSLSSTGNKD
jgi:hypothetical protein